MSKTSNTIVVQQTVHGYNDGHRLLAGSVDNLASKDQQMLLVMSDASGPGLSTDSRGYLTGYPLEHANLFAVARTWSASEMPRPGCVWTHTLLIDFADLASLTSLGALLTAFRRPNKDSFAEYSKPLKLAARQIVLPDRPPLRAFTEKVLTTLYGSGLDGILDGAPLTEDEELAVIEIWSQQWPRLRRGFRFCTHAAIEHHSVSPTFDLQFLTKGQLSPPSKGMNSQRPTWLDIASNDLFNPTDLRVFLKELASDIHGSPKQIFRSLVELYPLFNSQDVVSFERAVELVNSVTIKGSGEALWGFLLYYALTHLSEKSTVQNEFVAANASKITPELLYSIPKNSYLEMWSAMPSLVASWLSANDPKHKVASEILKQISIVHVVSELPRIGEGVSDLIQLRPEILEQADIWSKASYSTKRKLLDLVPKNWPHWTQAMSAMMVGGAAELAADVRKAAGPVLFVKGVLSHFEDRDADRITRAELEWLRVACSQPAVVSEFLASVEKISERSMLALTQFLAPDALPNEFGHDPWYRAMEIASGKGEQSRGHKFICSYLLARALGRRSRSQGELIALTFDVVYKAAANDSIPYDGWNLLDFVLPNSSLWFDWDKCQRLREGVVDTFINRPLGTEAFLSATSDMYLFHELSRLMSRRSGGRRYLREVLAELRSAPILDNQRIEIVSDLIE